MATTLSPVPGTLMKEISRRAISLQNPARDLDLLIERISKAKVVMLGEASHGTHEFYEWRRLISQILISSHGFNTMSIEGDWPPCQEVNRYITSDKTTPAEQVLAKAFTRWPTWMWANHEFKSMVEWMKEFNREQRERKMNEGQVRVFGLDVYSLFESIEVVLQEVAKIDPELQSLVEFPEGCRAEAVRVLRDLLMKRMDEQEQDNDLVFDAQQNARIVRNAENYYRAMVYGNEDSWNVRERHMMETLDLVLNRKPNNKLIIWAHNTHIGDYRATSMRKLGQVNIGGLVREKYGENDVALVGFGTFQGSVTASSKWTGPIMELSVPEGRDGSYERIMHDATINDVPGEAFYLLLDDPEVRKSDHQLAEWRGQRAIGVVYDPKKEKWGNYVPTQLSNRYDAFLYIHTTRALQPLRVKADVHEMPETYPTGM